MKCYTLDACAVIAMLYDEIGSDSINEIFVQAANSQVEMAMHNVNVAEVYSIIHKKEGRDNARNALERLNRSPIRFVSAMDENFLNVLATIRAKYKTHFTDSFVIATNQALAQGGTILTSDRDFEKIRDIAAVFYFR